MAVRTDIIGRQRAELTAHLRRFVARGEKYALLDFPNHSNVGDSAIWLGAVEILREITGRSPSYVSTDGADFDTAELRAAVVTGPIFIHGGGNFGDIWPSHQKFRHDLMDQFRDRTIIQLPQSIRFADPATVAETVRAIDRHGDFHLFVRDAASEAFARANFSCPVLLTPDCALGLNCIPSSHARERDILFLLRTDKERAGIDDAIFSSVEDSMQCDWLDESRPELARSFRRGRRRAWLHGRFSKVARRFDVFDALARSRLERGLRLIDGSDRVITDRLHVHILSTLLGVPHVALDNNYGKISSYIDQWMKEIDIVTTALTADAAIEQLAKLPPRDRTP